MRPFGVPAVSKDPEGSQNYTNFENPLKVERFQIRQVLHSKALLALTNSTKATKATNSYFY